MPVSQAKNIGDIDVDDVLRALPASTIAGGGILNISSAVDIGTLSCRPVRLDHYRLLLVATGQGEWLVNFRSYQLQPMRLFLVLPGQVFGCLEQAKDYWLVNFNPSLLDVADAGGLLDHFAERPFIDLMPGQFKVLHTLVEMLGSAYRNTGDLLLSRHYLNLLVAQANYFYKERFGLAILHPWSAPLAELRSLIDKHFKTEKRTAFYAQELGIVPRKLNEMTMLVMGRLVEGMIYDRLLAEAEAMLALTVVLIKEISYELGFVTQDHFAFFFRQRKGMPPTHFRRLMQQGLKQ